MKYKLTDEKIDTPFGVLSRIEAVSDFGDIKAGDKGGFVHSENNLSQISGNAWVYGNARVYGDAQVSGNARVYGNARVSGNARVYGDARVSGDAQVSGNAQVYGDAIVKFNCELDFIVIGNFGTSQRTVTATKTMVYAGCFEGSFTEFEDAVKEKYGDDYGGAKGGYADCIKILQNWMEK